MQVSWQFFWKMLPISSSQICRFLSRNISKSTLCNIYQRSLSTLPDKTFVTSKDGKHNVKDSRITVLTSRLQSIELTSSLTSHPVSLSSPRLQKISPSLPGHIIELPRPCISSIVFNLPPVRTILPVDTPLPPSLEAPSIGNEEKQAARLIVIRRRKMKKHKLQKLRKKMKFEWAKVRQKREMRKEKAFQAVLLSQIREAEKFNAEAYVTEKIRKAKEVPLPRTWKGRRLPEFLIKQYLGIK